MLLGTSKIIYLLFFFVAFQMDEKFANQSRLAIVLHFFIFKNAASVSLSICVCIWLYYIKMKNAENVFNNSTEGEKADKTIR